MTSTTSLADHLVLPDGAQRLLFHDARTANTFTDEPVTDEHLHAIYELVKWAPSAANSQPLRVLAIQSPAAKARLVPLMDEGNRAKTESAPLTVVLAADLGFFEHWDRLLPFRPGGGEVFAQRPEVAERMARFNATVQTGYFLLGVRAAGLAAGPMAGFDAGAVDAEFFADTSLRSILVVNIGRPGPDAWFDRLPRLEHHEVVTTI